jgi:O-antigen ligase
LPFISAFIIFFFWLGDSLIESTFLTFLVALPFENAIRQWLLYSNPNITDGYVLYFSVTLKIVFGFLLLLLFLIPKNKALFKKAPPSKNAAILLIFIILTTITSIFFQERVSTVLLGYIQLILAALYFFSASIFFSKLDKKPIFTGFIVALTIFSSLFGLAQLIKQSPTGRYIELTPSFAKTTGYTTTDGKPQYRVAGFISHPVYFGSFLSILIPIIIGLFFEKRQLIYLPLIAVSIVTLLGTLSRSTWINLAIIFLLFYLYQKTHPLHLPSIKLPKIFTKYFLPLSITLLLFLIIPIIITRIESVPELLNNKNGSIYTRLNLAVTSLKITQYYPLTGIGLNSFTLELHSAPPHNTLLIFLVELGIPATLLFVVFIIRSLTPIPKLKKTPPLPFGVWVGLLTFFVVSSQLHPLFNLDPTFDLFMLVLGYYATCRPSMI